MVLELAGNVPGPVSHVTLCEFDALTQLNVTCPAGTVSGVGFKELLLTVSAVVCPPGLLPVELLHAATNAATASSVAAVRAKCIAPPRVSSGQTCYSYPRFLDEARELINALHAPGRQQRGGER